MNLDERPPGPSVGVCDHGRPAHIPCADCTDQPQHDDGPRMSRTFPARYDGRCPCGRLIFIGDRVCHHDHAIRCRGCTADIKGRPVTPARHPSDPAETSRRGATEPRPEETPPCP